MGSTVGLLLYFSCLIWPLVVRAVVSQIPPGSLGSPSTGLQSFRECPQALDMPTQLSSVGLPTPQPVPVFFKAWFLVLSSTSEAHVSRSIRQTQFLAEFPLSSVRPELLSNISVLEKLLFNQEMSYSRVTSL